MWQKVAGKGGDHSAHTSSQALHVFRVVKTRGSQMELRVRPVVIIIQGPNEDLSGSLAV